MRRFMSLGKQKDARSAQSPADVARDAIVKELHHYFSSPSSSRSHPTTPNRFLEAAKKLERAGCLLAGAEDGTQQQQLLTPTTLAEHLRKVGAEFKSAYGTTTERTLADLLGEMGGIGYVVFVLGMYDGVVEDWDVRATVAEVREVWRAEVRRAGEQAGRI